MKRKTSWIIAVAISIVSPSMCVAHPFAVTDANVEYNAKEHLLEVALRLYPEQLDQALSQEFGHPVCLEKTAQSTNSSFGI